MKCPQCHKELRKVDVKIFGAQNKASTYQCTSCDYFEFDANSTKKVLEELRDSPLKIKQKIVKLSSDRLGIYFNQHVVRSLDLKSGEEISLSVPDHKHILLEIK